MANPFHPENFALKHLGPAPPSPFPNANATSKEAPHWPSGRYAHHCALVENETRLLSFGGVSRVRNGSSESTSTLCSYSFAKGIWTELDPSFSNRGNRKGNGKAFLPTHRASFTRLVRTRDQHERGVLFGGFASPGGCSNETYEYDVTLNEWTFINSSGKPWAPPQPQVPSARVYHQSVAISPPEMLTFGGYSFKEIEPLQVFIYSVDSGLFRQAEKFQTFPKGALRRFRSKD